MNTFSTVLLSFAPQKQCHNNEQFYCSSFYDPTSNLWERMTRKLDLTAPSSSFFGHLRSFFIQLGLRKRPQREITSLETLYDSVAIPLSCTEFLSDEEYRKVKGNVRVCGWNSKKGNSEDSAFVDPIEAKKQRKESLVKERNTDGSNVIVIDEANSKNEKKRKRNEGGGSDDEKVSHSSGSRLSKLKKMKETHQEDRVKAAISEMPSFMKKVFISFLSLSLSSLKSFFVFAFQNVLFKSISTFLYLLVFLSFSSQMCLTIALNQPREPKFASTLSLMITFLLGRLLRHS